MNELTEKPKRPMDRTLMGNDAASLRQLTALLNDPRITGAVVPPEEKAVLNATGAPARQPEAPVTQLPTDPLNGAAPTPRAIERISDAPVAAPPLAGPKTPHQRLSKPATPQRTQTAPQVVSAHLPAQKLFFTGHSGAGKSYLAEQLKARVFEFNDPIYALAASVFGEVSDVTLLEPFVAEVTAWGEGSLTAPLTTPRAMFIDYMREAGEEGDKLMGVPVSEFGTPGFWTRCLLARVARFQAQESASIEKVRINNTTEKALDSLAANRVPHLTPVAVTHIETPDQWRSLQVAGFRPYHVACLAATRVARGASVESPVAVAIDRDITQKLSQHKDGGKLWCIWNDPQHPSPSNRLLSLQEFLGAYK
jgi:hypothetical protein